MSQSTDPSALNWHLLPASVQEMAELCGRGCAFAVVRYFAGQHLLVPKRAPPAGHRLWILGVEHVEPLVQHYGDTLLTVPRCFHALLAVRNEAIREAGRTRYVHEIAAEWGLTERQVYKILGRGKPTADPNQPDLFGA